jgi:hypothetical protein
MAFKLPRRNQISRRAMLRGMLGGAAVTIGLPALEIFLNEHGTAYADCTAFPKRFGIFYWGNGNIPDAWTPTRTGAGYDLPEMLMPLAPVQSDVTVVSGMRVLTSNTSPHGSGPAGLFSGADLVNDTFVGPSLDQRIADGIATLPGGIRRFHSLEIGVQRSTSSWSMTGPHQVNPPECDPFAFFTRVFGPEYVMPGTHAMPDPRLALRRSVLDAVTDQSARLRARVGAADRARLDAHLDGIRALETQLDALAADPPSLAACMPPTGPMAEYPDVDGRPQMQAVHRALVDILVMALACDQTRVFFEMFSQPVNNTLFLDAPAGHHQLTHDEPDPQVQVTRIVQFIMGEYAYLVQRLGSVMEGSSRLLDNCAILGTTDVSFGRTHSLEEYPILVAGNACGALRSGIHYRSASGENASKVCMSLMRACGVPAAEYGMGAAHTTDGLGAIEV